MNFESPTLRNNKTVGFSRQIQEMFTAIAPSYDFLNYLLSIGQDKYWRKKAVDKLAPEKNERILDIATGTGDVLLEIAKRNHPIKIVGIDFSRRMLDIGREKVINSGYSQSVSFQIANGECLPFSNAKFDGIVCAFGIRNFSDIKLGLREIHRSLKPNGRVVILEFSMPTNSVLSYFYNWYFNYILPFLGNLISCHDLAYSYLPQSVVEFPDHKKFIRWIEETGFQKVTFKKLSFGIVSIYYGKKN